MKAIRASLVYSTLLLLLALALLVPRLARYSEAQGALQEILKLDFSNQAETLKHLDTTTENYDSAGDGSSKEYVDTSNEFFVFEGDNTDTSQGYDEPIAVVQGYGESDGYYSYATLPYNYVVVAYFMVPSSPGYGNFYILPRYENVNNKYEVVVDTQYNNIVFNYVKNGAWSNIKTEPLGFSILKDKWYMLSVEVRWEYNSEQDKYMNHIIAIVRDLDNPSNSYTSEIWDDNLPPSDYNGLAFLGFHSSQQFKVYMDNILVGMEMEKVFEEHSEAISPGDLDMTQLYVASDGTFIFYKIVVGSPISPDATSTKYWSIQLDVDKDSRDTENGWDVEYFFTAQIAGDSSASASLYDSSGNWLKSIHILGGGIGYDYLVLEVSQQDLSGLGDSLYLYGYTRLGSSVKDGFPRDDVDASFGDYVIYYLSPPEPTSDWTSLSDVQGDASIDSLDLVAIESAYSDTLLFFKVSVAGSFSWYGGSDTGIYRVYIDADNNPSTGYRIGGIGADYLLEHVVGYSPKLWSYSGGGSDWSWSFVKREDYLSNPGGESSAVYVVPKNDFNVVQLGPQIVILGETAQGASTVDGTQSLPAPIPEAAQIVAVAAIVGLLLVLGYYRLPLARNKA